MKEIYKAIENFDNYAVSNLGKVRNVKTGRILKAGVDKDGYLMVCLSKNGKKNSYNIHRLVAIAFLDKVEGKLVVDHIDNNRQNNSIKNLR